MALNKLYDSIRSLTESFAKRFRLCACVGDYLQFSFNNITVYCNITLMKTSQHTYIAMVYLDILNCGKMASCMRFRTLKDMCIYLDTLSSQLV